MLERVARHVLSFTADVGDHDADVGNRDDRRFLDLDGRKPRIDEIAAGQNDLLLQPLAAAGVDKRLGVLKGVVPVDRLAGNLAGRQRTPFFRGHDAQHVVRNVEDLHAPAR